MEMIVTGIILEEIVGRIGGDYRSNVQWLTANIVNRGIKLEQPPPAAIIDALFQ